MNKKIKVQPLTCTKGTSVQAIGKSITDIMTFMFSVVDDTNKVIADINKSIDSIPEDYNAKLEKAAQDIVKGIKIPQPTEPYNDTDIKKSISRIESKIPERYDDAKLLSEIKSLKQQLSDASSETNIIKKIVGVEQKIPAQYNDSNVVDSLNKITSAIDNLSKEIESVKKSVSLNQAEIRSYRNITGGSLDEMRRKLDKLTEIK